MRSMKISVIIPVKNGGVTLKRCLESIRNQVNGKEIEIIILNTNSTDDSVSIAKFFSATILSVEPSSFNHGLTRNIGVEEATGNLLFFTVQDAWLSEPDLLERMSHHFTNPKIMGVTGHQAVPHEKDKNPKFWHQRFNDPVPELRQWEPGKPMPLFSWDNVVAMYRKTALEQLPFEQTDTTEDWIWAHAALKKQWSIVYDQSILIWHYHHRTFKYIVRCDFSVHYTLYKNFGILPPKRTSWLINNAKDMIHLLKHKKLTVDEKFKWIIHNVIANTAVSITVILFKLAQTISNKKGLDFLYRKLCNQIPQGRQNFRI